MGYGIFAIVTLLTFLWGLRRARPIVRCEHPPGLDALRPYVRRDGKVIQVPFWKKIREREQDDRYALVTEKNRVAKLKRELDEQKKLVESLYAQNDQLWDKIDESPRYKPWIPEAPWIG